MARNGHERRMRQFDCLYAYQGDLGDPCSYCGMESTTWDHIPPLNYVERLCNVELTNAILRKIPACAECNSLLGAKILTTLAARRHHVKSRLRQKYRSWAEMPNWDSEEIAELSTADARKYIEQHRRFSALIKQRLGYWP